MLQGPQTMRRGVRTAAFQKWFRTSVLLKMTHMNIPRFATCFFFFFLSSICLPDSIRMNHFRRNEIIKNSTKGWVAFILGKLSKACSKRAMLTEVQVVFGKQGCRWEP